MYYYEKSSLGLAYILQDQYLFLSVHLSQKNPRDDQNVHFFDVTPYIIFTHTVFLCL